MNMRNKAASLTFSRKMTYKPKQAWVTSFILLLGFKARYRESAKSAKAFAAPGKVCRVFRCRACAPSGEIMYMVGNVVLWQYKSSGKEHVVVIIQYGMAAVTFYWGCLRQYE